MADGRPVNDGPPPESQPRPNGEYDTQLHHPPPRGVLPGFPSTQKVSRLNEWLQNVDDRLNRLGRLQPFQPTLSTVMQEGDVVSLTSAGEPGHSFETMVMSPTPTPEDPVHSNVKSVGYHDYRRINLDSANIEYWEDEEPLPEDVVALVAMLRLHRDSPGPKLEDVRRDVTRRGPAMEGGEAEVHEYYAGSVFPNHTGKVLQRHSKVHMMKHAVPPEVAKNPVSAPVSTPVPDLLYGYSDKAFSPGQNAQLIAIGERRPVDTKGLLLPFLVVEFKGSGASLWAADNECRGGVSSCVLVADRLNSKLGSCSDDSVQIDTHAFAISMNGSEARVFVSWKGDDSRYCMHRARSFVLAEPKQFIMFHKYVRNIVDWGVDQRLQQIREVLDEVIERDRKLKSHQAKARPAPSKAGDPSRRRRKRAATGRNRAGQGT